MKSGVEGLRLCELATGRGRRTGVEVGFITGPRLLTSYYWLVFWSCSHPVKFSALVLPSSS